MPLNWNAVNVYVKEKYSGELNFYICNKKFKTYYVVAKSPLCPDQNRKKLSPKHIDWKVSYNCHVTGIFCGTACAACNLVYSWPDSISYFYYKLSYYGQLIL